MIHSMSMAVALAVTFYEISETENRPKFEPKKLWRNFVTSFVFRTLYNYILADAAWNDRLDETIKTNIRFVR